MKWQRVFFPLLVVCLGSCLAGNMVLAQEQEGQEAPGLNAVSAANLVVTSISGPKKAFLKQTVALTYEVKNQGSEASGAYKVELYLSKDKTINPANDRLLKTIAFPGGLLAGETAKTTTQVTIPSGELSGSYYYGAAVGSSSKSSVEKVSIVRYEADSLKDTVTDHKTGLIWQQADDGMEKEWNVAKTYCDKLILGGHEDWRLPRIDELQTIVAYSRFDPAIDPVFDCRSDFYWSSSKYKDDADYIWYVFFTNGAADVFGGNYSFFVRCVRGGPW